MKIGFFSDDYHPRIDGVVSYMDSMSQALESLGHEVYIICPKYPGHRESEGRIIRVDGYDPLPLSKLTSRMMITNRRVLNTVEKLNLDVIHSHTQSGSNFTAYMLAKRTGKMSFATVHTTYHQLIDVYPGVTLFAAWMGNFVAWRYYHDYGALKSLFVPPFPLKKRISVWLSSYLKSVLDHSSLVLTNSKHTKAYVKSLGSKTPIKIVRNGVDRSFFKPQKEVVAQQQHRPFEFVLTSRLSREKRQVVAIKAIAKLIADGYDCHLTLVGGGVARKEYAELIDNLGISDKVTITGEVALESVRTVLAGADVGLFTSYRFDTDPLAVKEYLSMGLPVIYCDDNFDDMFLRGAAKRCDKDFASFAKAMESIMRDTEKLKKMRKQALKSAEKHDIIDRARELEKVYAEAIKSD